MPNRIPVKIETSTVKPSTRGSIAISADRGTLSGSATINARSAA